ncbi:type IV pilus twitching motility protein PilT [Paraconexibacter sp.]|uniref:type IV pilus twitching motility protein PilT n=1 Tax=Paraconexibacter sp. TaxID=2949640 RepID=UPI0035650237
MPFDIDSALTRLVEAGGSDLHLKVPSTPMMRVDGELRALEGMDALREDETTAAVDHMLGADETKRQEFAEHGEVDFSYAIAGLARFRVNAFRQRGWCSLVCRAIPVSIRTIDELALPPVIRELAEEERGIVLLTGTTGSGKSTTLAAMIDHINATRHRHVMTIEDPIEFLHQDKKSVINQREVGTDTAGFKQALRRVLRQDPDVILIGEMRDEETVQTALSAAETGHLVFSTVHTVDAPETVNRLIEFFPPHMHQQVRAMIASTLKGAVSQRLVPAAEGRGRVAVCEVLRMTGRVRDMIMDPTQTGKLGEVIADGGYYGMQTFDQALFHHLKAGRITMDEALQASSAPHDFKLLVAADGRRGTTMDDLAQAESERSTPVNAAASLR